MTACLNDVILGKNENQWLEIGSRLAKRLLSERRSPQLTCSVRMLHVVDVVGVNIVIDCLLYEILRLVTSQRQNSGIIPANVRHPQASSFIGRHQSLLGVYKIHQTAPPINPRGVAMSERTEPRTAPAEPPVERGDPDLAVPAAVSAVVSCLQCRRSAGRAVSAAGQQSAPPESAVSARGAVNQSESAADTASSCNCRPRLSSVGKLFAFN